MLARARNWPRRVNKPPLEAGRIACREIPLGWVTRPVTSARSLSIDPCHESKLSKLVPPRCLLLLFLLLLFFLCPATNLGNVLSDESELTGQLYGSRCWRATTVRWSGRPAHTRYARPLRIGDWNRESVYVPRCLSSSTFIRDFRRMIALESRFLRKKRDASRSYLCEFYAWKGRMKSRDESIFDSFRFPLREFLSEEKRLFDLISTRHDVDCARGGT